MTCRAGSAAAAVATTEGLLSTVAVAAAAVGLAAPGASVAGRAVGVAAAGTLVGVATEVGGTGVGGALVAEGGALAGAAEGSAAISVGTGDDVTVAPAVLAVMRGGAAAGVVRTTPSTPRRAMMITLMVAARIRFTCPSSTGDYGRRAMESRGKRPGLDNRPRAR
jgi:hypothetical protein